MNGRLSVARYLLDCIQPIDHIHRNTLQLRLERISEVNGLDFQLCGTSPRNPDSAQGTTVALAFPRLRGARETFAMPAIDQTQHHD